MSTKALEEKLFSVQSNSDFEEAALAVFNFQFKNVPVYRKFCNLLNVAPQQIKSIRQIPFLPIEFFKSHQVLVENCSTEKIFTSSGTTGTKTSKHYIYSLKVYEQAFRKAFKQFYGALEDYVVLALLPAYLERKGSSLIYMVNDFIKQSKYAESGFYLNEYEVLSQQLKEWDRAGKKILLIGVSFALLDLIETESFTLKNTIIMETGGMKGRRKELTRQELHAKLTQGFGVNKIHSEYGMTELLSQAYSLKDGIFSCPSTMQVLIREPQDPLQILPEHKNGGINIIDLANLYSCSFIATQDLGKKINSHEFEVLGRFDHSDVRGCNLMVI